MSNLPLASTFTVQVNRELFVLGSEDDQQVIAKALESLSFIKVRGERKPHDAPNDLYFVVSVTDFTNNRSVAKVASQFTDITDTNVHRIIYALAPPTVGLKDFLLAAEVGGHYVASGADRDGELRRYVKRIALQAEQLGSITHFENEVARMVRKQDQAGLKALDERLAGLDKSSEAVVKLRATINLHLGRHSRFEHFLKQVLTINPQNLWAAGELGKHFLRMRRPKEGIALLEKLSRFHDLNGERHITLGNAYLNVGNHAQAEKSFEKAQALDMDDSRVEEGMAKVKVLQGDNDAALALLHDNVFSDNVISFLNMRAVMAIKLGDFEQGYLLYHHALTHCPKNDVLKAKLHYNLGLGYVRNNKTLEAATEFERSVFLGGKVFRRAVTPLDITRKILKGQKQSRHDQNRFMSDFRFEEFDSAVTGFEEEKGAAS